MIPTPHTLGVKRYSAGAADGHGNTAPGYGTATPWPVHAVAPGAMVEPGQANRDLSLILYTVLAPADDRVPGERDRVVLDGPGSEESRTYEVNGRPADWSRGPWPYPDAGVAVELRRAEG